MDEKEKGMDPERQRHAMEYYKALKRDIQLHEQGDVDDSYLDEEILDELDEEIEPRLEEQVPHLYIKRIAGLKFLVYDKHKVEKLIKEKYEDK